MLQYFSWFLQTIYDIAGVFNGSLELFDIANNQFRFYRNHYYIRTLKIYYQYFSDCNFFINELRSWKRNKNGIVLNISFDTIERLMIINNNSLIK